MGEVSLAASPWEGPRLFLTEARPPCSRGEPCIFSWVAPLTAHTAAGLSSLGLSSLCSENASFLFLGMRGHRRETLQQNLRPADLSLQAEGRGVSSSSLVGCENEVRRAGRGGLRPLPLPSPGQLLACRLIPTALPWVTFCVSLHRSLGVKSAVPALW